MWKFKMTAKFKVFNLFLAPDKYEFIIDGEAYDLIDVFDHLDLSFAVFI